MIPIFYCHYLDGPALGEISENGHIKFYDFSNPVVKEYCNGEGNYVLDPGIILPGGKWEDAYISEISIVPVTSLVPPN